MTTAPLHDPQSGRRAASPAWPAVLAIALALGAGLAARVAAWPRVLTGRGVRLAFDTDPYYHVLQAERILSGRSVWVDPWLDWPHGAKVLWPPLFDALIAGTARLAFGPTVSRPELELIAAIVPVVIGLLTIPLVAALGASLLGRGRGVAAGLLVAVLPGTVLWSSVGAADQHCAEILLWCAALLAFVVGWRSDGSGARRAAAAGLAVAIAAAFWNWQGAAFSLVPPVLFTAAAHVLLPREAAAARAAWVLAVGLGAGAALLALSIAALGAPGALAHGELAGVGGLHVAIVAGAATFAGVLVAARVSRRGEAGPLRRVAELVVALLAPAAAAMASPALRSGVVHGVTALAAANPWYPEIAEFRHLVFSGVYTLQDDLRMFAGTYGLTFAAALLAIPALLRRARGEGRAVVLFLACWAIPLLALALVRRRFAPYLTVPVAVLTAEGLSWLATAAQARVAPARRGVAFGAALLAGALVLAPTIPALRDGVTTQDEGDLAAMSWLATQPGAPGREGVLATWDLGHLVEYFGRKPVVTSPFGTDASVASMIDAARFDLATDPRSASELLRARRVGFVVLSPPLATALIDGGFLPDAFRPPLATARSGPAGRVLEPSPDYFDGVAARLFYLDGRAGRGRRVAPIDGLRLVYEAPGQRIKIFTVTAGAELAISRAVPGEEVSALVRLVTNQGRDTIWLASGTADGSGAVTLRVPYATGWNGAVQATAAIVRAGTRTVPVTLKERDVSTGARVVVLVDPSGPVAVR